MTEPTGWTDTAPSVLSPLGRGVTSSRSRATGVRLRLMRTRWLQLMGDTPERRASRSLSWLAATQSAS
jgi:hypothetical protein